MNRRRFQKQMYEYVEGTPASGARAAAEQHLTSCIRCRETVRREQEMAQALSSRFRLGTESLMLGAEVRRNIVAAARRQPASPTLVKSLTGWWRSVTVPAAIGACVVAVTAILAFCSPANPITMRIFPSWTFKGHQPSRYKFPAGYPPPHFIAKVIM